MTTLNLYSYGHAYSYFTSQHPPCSKYLRQWGSMSGLGSPTSAWSWFILQMRYFSASSSCRYLCCSSALARCSSFFTTEVVAMSMRLAEGEEVAAACWKTGAWVQGVFPWSCAGGAGCSEDIMILQTKFFWSV